MHKISSVFPKCHTLLFALGGRTSPTGSCVLLSGCCTQKGTLLCLQFIEVHFQLVILVFELGEVFLLLSQGLVYDLAIVLIDHYLGPLADFVHFLLLPSGHLLQFLYLPYPAHLLFA